MNAPGQLRAFVERVERIEEEIKSLNADKSEIFKEAKGSGFDVPTMKKVISKRRLDPIDRDEADAMFDLYWSTLHGAPSRVHVHEAEVQESGPQTGAVGAEGIANPPAGNSSAFSSAHTGSASDEMPAPIPEEPFTPPAFLHRAPKPLRPNCLRPQECAGYGSHECHSCRKAAAETEVVPA